MLFTISRYNIVDILLYASLILKTSGRTNVSEKKSRAIRISLAYDRFSMPVALSHRGLSLFTIFRIYTEPIILHRDTEHPTPLMSTYVPVG